MMTRRNNHMLCRELLKNLIKIFTFEGNHTSKTLRAQGDQR